MVEKEKSFKTYIESPVSTYTCTNILMTIH